MANEAGGYAATGFEAVAAEFERNFTRRGDVGAAFAVARGDKLLVDLWGGFSDRGANRQWQQNTLQLIFSGSKGLVAVCVLILIERGQIELDAPIARYWPEFGKEAIRVRDVVSHTARLPGVKRSTTFADLPHDRLMARTLAAQPQDEDPRAGFCYHGLTYGWLCGELVRRVTGRSIGRFFREEVAEPLALDAWIGLSPEHESRVSTLELAPTWPASEHLKEEAWAEDELLWSIWGNPPVLARDHFPWNSREYHDAEIAAVGAIGSARSIAVLYGSLERLLKKETIELGTTTLSCGYDTAHNELRRFGVGFELQTEARTLGPPADAFGHGGAGGSIHGCWPTHGIGFSYAMNLMRDDEGDETRAQALLRALHEAVR